MDYCKEGVPIFVVANKCDLARKVTKAEGRQLGHPYFETSASNGDNVESVFQCMAEEIKREHDFSD